jgi:hypothetical protein
MKFQSTTFSSYGGYDLLSHKNFTTWTPTQQMGDCISSIILRIVELKIVEQKSIFKGFKHKLKELLEF